MLLHVQFFEGLERGKLALCVINRGGKQNLLWNLDFITFSHFPH